MNNNNVSSLLPKLKTTLLTSCAVWHTDRPGAYQWKTVVSAGLLHYCTLSSCIILWFSPGFRTPLRGLERTIPVSVIPYLSRSLCPVISSHRWNRGDGRGDEPLTISLTENKCLKHSTICGGHFMSSSFKSMYHGHSQTRQVCILSDTLRKRKLNNETNVHDAWEQHADMICWQYLKSEVECEEMPSHYIYFIRGSKSIYNHFLNSLFCWLNS